MNWTIQVIFVALRYFLTLLNVDIILFPHLNFEIFLAEKFIKEALSNIVTHNLDVLIQSLLDWSIVEDMY